MVPLTAHKDADITVSMDWMDWVAVDPAYSIAWWQISAEAVTEARARLHRVGSSYELVLRVTQSATSGPRTTDVPIDALSGERVVMLGEPGAIHHASVGLQSNGFYTAIARAPALVAPALRCPS